MKKKRRAFEVFTLSFLDCICCGFGAVVLFYTIVQAQAGAQEILRLDELTGEVRKLEEEVKVGQKNLVVLRNALEKTDEDAAAAKARAIRVAAELKKIAGDLGPSETTRLATPRAHQQADRRHQVAGRRQQAAAGRRARQGARRATRQGVPRPRRPPLHQRAAA